MWGKRSEMPITAPPPYTNTNTTTSTHFSSLNGTFPGSIDYSSLVSNNQAVFDKFSKAVQDPEVSAAFDNIVNIWD